MTRLLARRSPLSSVVRLNDIVNLLLPPQPLSRVRQAGGSSTDTGNARAQQLLALTDLVTRGIGSDSSSSASDQASFSPAALGLAQGGSPVVASGTSSADPGVIQQTSTTTDGSTDGQSLGGVVESYIRRRAILTYSLPAVQPGGATVSLTFDVEAGQHTIQFFGPSGTQLDRTA